MIITRSPLRISLGGGGTDLPSYYEKFGGFLIAAAIDRYVYVTINRPFGAGIRLKYSDIENVDTVEEVRHPILREALRMMNFRTHQGMPPPHSSESASDDKFAHPSERDHPPRRDSARHRTGIVGQFHHRAGQGAVRTSPAPAAFERGGATGLRDRDRAASRAG